MRTRALAALRASRWQEAAEIYARLLEQASQPPIDSQDFGYQDHAFADDATNFGALLRQLGRSQDAFSHYQQWLRRCPHHLPLRLNGINCLIELNELPLAGQWIDAGLELQPSHLELLQARARVWLREGQLAAARHLLEQLTQTHPQQLASWLELSLACHRLGDRPAALAASQRATAIDPQSAGGWGNQITLLKELGRLEDAATVLDALPPSLRPHPDVRRAAADLWMEQQLMAEAEAELAELCQLQPQEPGHWVNRAACLRHLKHFVAAAGVLKTGLRWAPHNLQLQESLGHCLAEIGQAERGMAHLRRCLPWDDRLSDSSHASLQFLGAGYGTISPSERRELAQAWERRKQAEGVGPLWADRIREPLAGRRLRVGYLSADCCNHPVGRFLLPLLQHHDHTNVEVWGLSCGPHQDNVTDALKACCDHWLTLRFGSDLEIARLMADQQLDVLVELGGFTGLSRIGAMVHKPAPVQLSYLGYFAPTYLTAIDGWIGDAELFGQLNPIDRLAHRLVEVEGGYMAYAEADLPPPERVDGAPFRFGSFNHSRKLSRRAVELFCAVMAAVPEAELVLKSVSFIEAAERQRIRQLFSAAGLEPERLLVLPWVEGRSQHLASYSQLDVALDPLPYGGATTTCEALAMGVPVVTLAGEGMVERLSASILAAAGLGGLIASSGPTYVAVAQELADQGLRTAAERLALRRQLLESPLGDGQRLARALEQRYRALASEALQALR